MHDSWPTVKHELTFLSMFWSKLQLLSNLSGLIVQVLFKIALCNSWHGSSSVHLVHLSGSSCPVLQTHNLLAICKTKFSSDHQVTFDHTHQISKRKRERYDLCWWYHKNIWLNMHVYWVFSKTMLMVAKQWLIHSN